MNLRDFLTTTDQTATAFAAKIGVTHSAVVKWMSGQTRPRNKVLAVIARETHGQVTANDFYTADQPAAPEQGGAA